MASLDIRRAWTGSSRFGSYSGNNGAVNPLDLLQELVSIPGPPGQESAVCGALATHVAAMGLASETDAKGNLIVRPGDAGSERIVVTAHMDEIALMVRAIDSDGGVRVSQLGGIHPWKLGEGPVTILSDSGPIEAVLGFGSIHTESPVSPAVQSRSESVKWDSARVISGKSATELKTAGVRPGTRVVVSLSRRNLTMLGDLVAGHFLDDRADLVCWLLALKEAHEAKISCTFVATAAEEVGGEGALYFLNRHPAEVCIALELGPNVPDAPVDISANPTVWAKDGYAAMAAADLELMANLGFELQFQALSRGGSDASCAASHGLCARPFTLGLPMDNSHGYEIIHKDSMARLAEVTAALLARLGAS